MGKEYLVNSKLQGKDIATSRAPQRYGLTTLESNLYILLALSLAVLQTQNMAENYL